MPAAATIAEPRRVDFARLPGFTDLFTTYCSDYETVSDFYAGNPFDVEARRSAANRAAAHERDRETLADVLHDQYDAWGLDDEGARRNIDQLRDPEAVAVVTGQQVGLFTGPLYTLAKTLSTLRVTEQLAGETGRPVVPVFWVEGEDHDFDEIAEIHLLRRNEPVTVRYEGPETDNPGPVGRLELTDAIGDVVAEIDEALPSSDFKPAVMEAVRAAYRPGVRIEDAFVQFMHALLPDSGLVFLNPDDARLKRLAAPLFRREIETYDELADGVEAQSERLRERFHAQVHVSATNLFLLDDAGRLPLDVDDDGTFRLRGTDRTFADDELLDLLERSPERFSPNVVLRPLMQDLLLPTAAYVAGPGEIAYFGQYRLAYDWAELPMPVVYPRASVSLVESKVQKVLDRHELDVADVGAEIERLFQKVVVSEMEVDVDEAFQEALRPLHQAINDLKTSIEQVDRTLVKSAEATRAALMKEMEELKSRVVRAEKRNHDEVRAQLQKAHVNLFPNGVQQERYITPLYFLNKYGLSLVDHLYRSLSLDTREHQVVAL